MGTKRQPKRAGATRVMCQFYLTETQRDVVARAVGSLTFSAYAASAVLKEAVRDGAVFYGDVRDGACARASPDRERRCDSRQPASWWNRHALVFYCPACAAQINDLEPGTCLSPEEQRGPGREPTT